MEIHRRTVGESERIDDINHISISLAYHNEAIRTLKTWWIVTNTHILQENYVRLRVAMKVQ